MHARSGTLACTAMSVYIMQANHGYAGEIAVVTPS